MCRMKSMILLKDRVFCPDYDSHADMLEALKIKDDKPVPTFVKIEIVPPNGDISAPVSTWHYEPDQDRFPEWYVRDVDEKRCRDALDEWALAHVFTNGKHEVNGGVYFALGNSTVTAWDNSTVKARDNSTVEAWDNATVTARDNSTVKAWGSSTVKACGNSTVEAWGNATVTARDNSTVKALDSSTVTAWGSATVEAFSNATVTAWGNATVKALHNRSVAIKRKRYDSKPIVTFADECQ